MKMIKKIFLKILYKIRGLKTTDELIRNGLIVGKNFNRMYNVNIDDSHCWLIQIGDNVTLAPNSYILAHDASTKNILGYTKIGKVIIGNNVFVGAGTIILPNVKIGDNVVIGAGSIVSKNLDSNSVYVGNPCKKISAIEDYKIKNINLMKDNVYDETYTKRYKINKEKKEEMKEKLNQGIGFVK